MARTKNFAEVVKRKLAANPALAARVEEAAFQYNVAEQIHSARVEAALTQSQLAELAGTHQSVIARLEDADYDGHTLSMLRRIADAMGKDLFIAFEEKQPKTSRAGIPVPAATPPLARRPPLVSKPKSVARFRKKKRNA